MTKKLTKIKTPRAKSNRIGDRCKKKQKKTEKVTQFDGKTVLNTQED